MSAYTRLFGAAVGSISLLSCASTPKGSLHYYFPKAQTQLSLTQTLSCTPDHKHLRQVITVAPTTVYSSDTHAKVGELSPSALDSTFADADVSFSFTDDGRLSGVNFTSTGQGTNILKDVVTIAAAAGVVAAEANGAVLDSEKACAIIESQGGKAFAQDGKEDKDKNKKIPPKATDDTGKADPPATIILTYNSTFYFREVSPGDDTKPPKIQLRLDPSKDVAADSIDLSPDPGCQTLYDQLSEWIGNLRFSVKVEGSERLKAAQWTNASAADVALKLNSVASTSISIAGPIGDLSRLGSIWQGHVYVPLTAAESDFFSLPIPVAKPFGTQKFVLGLSDYGSINKLQYSKSGTADSADAAATLAKVLKAPSDSQKASAVQSQADLIYQQQRLATCQADPKSCKDK